MYTGIDIGAKGGIVTLNNKGEIISMLSIPKNKEGVNRLELKEILISLEGFKYLEDVKSLYGMSAKSNFNFGYIKGFKTACVIDENTFFVRAKERQKTLRIKEDIVEVGGKNYTKATSLNCANRIFGVTNEYWRTSSRQRKAQDGLYDSALIAMYGWLQKHERTIEDILSS